MAEEQSRTIEKTIRESAAGPKAVEIDGQRVEQRSLKELVEADEYLAKKDTVKKGRTGLRFSKMEHPGSA